MSNPTIWRFTADNFNHNILVAPPFVKRRKLIYTPIILNIKFNHTVIPNISRGYTNESGYWEMESNPDTSPDRGVIKGISR